MPKPVAPPCYAGRGSEEQHRAEATPGDGFYVYAHHTGAWQFSCAEHSGMCHEECWPASQYPDIRPRIRKREAGTP